MSNDLTNINARFQAAEALYTKDALEEAAAIYLELESNPDCRALCRYRLAQISNKTQDPLTAYQLFYSALSATPNLFRFVLPKEHSNYQYVFTGLKQEQEITHCPLCGALGEPYWCYPLPETSAYNPYFNPIRLWLRCADCNHLFAKHYPEKPFIFNDAPRKANPAFFAAYSRIFSNIRKYTTGLDLLEVGIGACECALVAREIGYNVLGIDVIERHVESARNRFGLMAETHDFIEFETAKTWDVIIMGDVLEHVSSPLRAIEKAYELLNDGGALWISTPNFESAFAAAVGHDDAMRRQTFHLNYFSRDSLYKVLRQFHLEPVDYKLSEHYNGSMEVIAMKGKS